MKTFKNMTTAIKQAKEGRFEFVNDVKRFHNEIRRQTSSGEWVDDLILILEDNRK